MLSYREARALGLGDLGAARGRGRGRHPNRPPPPPPPRAAPPPPRPAPTTGGGRRWVGVTPATTATPRVNRGSAQDAWSTYVKQLSSLAFRLNNGLAPSTELAPPGPQFVGPPNLVAKANEFLNAKIPGARMVARNKEIAAGFNANPAAPTTPSATTAPPAADVPYVPPYIAPTGLPYYPSNDPIPTSDGYMPAYDMFAGAGGEGKVENTPGYPLGTPAAEETEGGSGKAIMIGGAVLLGLFLFAGKKGKRASARSLVR